MPKSAPSGFTLIEFLVASALSLIVITAAASTYLMTRRININAQERLNIQQNLRNATTLLSRDIRNAGSFGCFTTSGGTSKTFNNKKPTFPSTIQDKSIVLDANMNNGYGINVLPLNGVLAGNIIQPGFQALSDVLVLTYGKGFAGVTSNIATGGSFTLQKLQATGYRNDPDVSQTVARRGELVVSSCNAAYVAKPINGDNNSISFNNVPANRLADADDSQGELSITKLYASAYVLGTVNNVSSLLRYDLNADGLWQGPQLLAPNVTNMTFQFGYVNNCGNNGNATLNQEQFQFADTLNQTELPALVRIHLQYNTSTDRNKNDQVADYVINAAVRSGNTCATTTPN